jgi:hypothetical protein
LVILFGICAKLNICNTNSPTFAKRQTVGGNLKTSY